MSLRVTCSVQLEAAVSYLFSWCHPSPPSHTHTHTHTHVCDSHSGSAFASIYGRGGGGGGEVSEGFRAPQFWCWVRQGGRGVQSTLPLVKSDPRLHGNCICEPTTLC